MRLRHVLPAAGVCRCCRQCCRQALRQSWCGPPRGADAGRRSPAGRSAGVAVRCLNAALILSTAVFGGNGCGSAGPAPSAAPPCRTRTAPRSAARLSGGPPSRCRAASPASPCTIGLPAERRSAPASDQRSVRVELHVCGKEAEGKRARRHLGVQGRGVGVPLSRRRFGRTAVAARSLFGSGVRGATAGEQCRLGPAGAPRAGPVA
jgi:hypothetical protein